MNLMKRPVLGFLALCTAFVLCAFPTFAQAPPEPELLGVL